MIYNPEIIDDIRKFEREDAIEHHYSLQELNKRIKYETRKANYAICGMLSGFSGTIALGIYFGKKENFLPIMLSAICGSAALGISIAIGKIAAIRADAFTIAKQNLLEKILE